MKAMIIEDELLNRQALRELLKSDFPSVIIVGEATSGEEALDMIPRLNPDVLLLDIEMPGMSGFEMLEKLEQHPPVIFVTGFNKYALQAIKISALDYLMKPVKEEELAAALMKAESRLKELQWTRQLTQVLEMMRNPGYRPRLALPMLKETILVDLPEIVRAEATNAYTTFFFADDKKHTVSKHMSDYEEILLPYEFLRCHQSHIVNMAYVRKVSSHKGEGFLEFKNGHQVPVARSRRDMIKEYLKRGGKGVIGQWNRVD